MAYKNGIIKRHPPRSQSLTNQLEECSEYYQMFLNCGSTSPACESMRQMYHHCVNKARSGASLGTGVEVSAKGMGGSSIPLPVWVPIAAGAGLVGLYFWLKRKKK
jgi:hypothetical protein